MRYSKIRAVAVSIVIALAGITPALAWTFSHYSSPTSGADQYIGSAGLENGTGPNGGTKGLFYNGSFPVPVARLTYIYSDGTYTSDGSHDTRSNYSATVSYVNELQIWNVNTYSNGYSEVSNSEGNAWGHCWQ